MKTSGNTILITGGGSGIGKALAQRFHDLGNTVIIAGRRLAALEETAADRSRIYPAAFDIDNAASITDFARELVTDHPDRKSVV